jgi:Helix-turn-helix domain of resolvase
LYSIYGASALIFHRQGAGALFSGTGMLEPEIQLNDLRKAAEQGDALAQALLQKQELCRSFACQVEAYPNLTSGRAQAGETKLHLAREYGISRETVYQYLNRKPDA